MIRKWEDYMKLNTFFALVNLAWYMVVTVLIVSVANISAELKNDTFFEIFFGAGFTVGIFCLRKR